MCSEFCHVMLTADAERIWAEIRVVNLDQHCRVSWSLVGGIGIPWGLMKPHASFRKASITTRIRATKMHPPPPAHHNYLSFWRKNGLPSTCFFASHDSCRPCAWEEHSLKMGMVSRKGLLFERVLGSKGETHTGILEQEWRLYLYMGTLR